MKIAVSTVPASPADIEAQLRQCAKLEAFARELAATDAEAIGALLGAVVLIARARSNPDAILETAQDTLQLCRVAIAQHDARVAARQTQGAPS